MYSRFSRHLLHPRYWLTWLWLGLLALLAQLPFRWQMVLGRLLGRFLYTVLPRRRKIAQRNIELCFPNWNKQKQIALVKQHFEANGMAIFETGMAWFMPYWRLRRRFHIRGLQHWQKMQENFPNQGALVMGMHFNTLEIANVIINRLVDLSVTYRPHNNPVYDYVQRRGRGRHNPRAKVIARDDVRSMIRTMKEGGWLWYAADQDYGPRVSEFVPFFGIEAATVSAPSRLARSAQAAVVAISYHRLADDSGYEIIFMPAFNGLPSKDTQADLRLLNQHFEACIRHKPEEYLWVHRRFKTRPQGQASLY